MQIRASLMQIRASTKHKSGFEYCHTMDFTTPNMGFVNTYMGFKTQIWVSKHKYGFPEYGFHKSVFGFQTVRNLYLKCLRNLHLKQTRIWISNDTYLDLYVQIRVDIYLDLGTKIPLLMVHT